MISVGIPLKIIRIQEFFLPHLVTISSMKTLLKIIYEEVYKYFIHLITVYIITTLLTTHFFRLMITLIISGMMGIHLVVTTGQISTMKVKVLMIFIRVQTKTSQVVTASSTNHIISLVKLRQIR